MAGARRREAEETQRCTPRVHRTGGVAARRTAWGQAVGPEGRLPAARGGKSAARQGARRGVRHTLAGLRHPRRPHPRELLCGWRWQPAGAVVAVKTVLAAPTVPRPGHSLLQARPSSHRRRWEVPEPHGAPASLSLPVWLCAFVQPARSPRLCLPCTAPPAPGTPRCWLQIVGAAEEACSAPIRPLQPLLQPSPRRGATGARARAEQTWLCGLADGHGPRAAVPTARRPRHEAMNVGRAASSMPCCAPVASPSPPFLSAAATPRRRSATHGGASGAPAARRPATAPGGAGGAG
eukprot:scaffold32901_cov118-Isochrysis_galbana.AAC.3